MGRLILIFLLHFSSDEALRTPLPALYRELSEPATDKRHEDEEVNSIRHDILVADHNSGTVAQAADMINCTQVLAKGLVHMPSSTLNPSS